jgi:hypothetical protein
MKRDIALGWTRSIFFGLLVLAAASAPAAHAQQLQYFKDCVVGKRVFTNNDGRKGTITRLDPAWSYCYVRFDDNGKEVSMLYSLLNAEGGLDPKDLKLATGVYECIGVGLFQAGRLRINGPDTYSFGNAAGKYHVETSGKIVFETGPLKEEFSKLVSGGRIALNSTGKNFSEVTCELNRTLR